MIDYEKVEKGMVLVKEFFIVAMVPPTGEGFFICGEADTPDHHSPFDTDKILPCIGTNEKTARHNFKRAVEHIKGAGDGKMVLIKLTNGTVEMMEVVSAPGQRGLSA